MAERPSTKSSNPTRKRVKPSYRLLFRGLSRRHAPLVTVAVLLAVISGGLPPLMSRILGDVFDAYTAYNPTALPSRAIPQANKDELLRKILKGVWQLSILSIATMALSTAMISAWIVIGEKVATSLRSRVYISISQRKMQWFDLGMGLSGEDDEQGADEGHGQSDGQSGADGSSIGAGGLMAKFARETDDARLATSQYAGQLLQHSVTCVASLILALVISWSLALVVLASIPVTVIITGVVERYTGPWLAEERAHTARASGHLERVINAIATVKAFGGEEREVVRFRRLLALGTKIYNRTSYAWGVRIGISSFIIFSMFVQGFWYGSLLVQRGDATPGTVFTVFSACLLASNHLQLIIEALSVIEKGKIGAAGLETLMTSSDDVPSSGKSDGTPIARMRLEDIPTSPATANEFSDNRRRSSIKRASSKAVSSMRRIRPSSRCLGEITLRDIRFCYPATKQAIGEVSAPTLQDVNVYIPAGEATYIVGSSGSGKSTIAQLLLRLYRPDAGTIELDEQDIRFLDPEWCRAHIASVDQHPIVFDMSVHDNVALGLVGRAEYSTCDSQVPVVSRQDVIAACRMALLHDFVKGLPDGYDTMLGPQGASLSGGQKQRLAIARARLRDPTVLILDEATSALDPTSRLLINEAVKSWRRGKTTIIITHDLAQVESTDFLYMLKEGRVVEHGYRDDLEMRKTGLFASLAQQQEGSDEGQGRDVIDSADASLSPPPAFTRLNEETDIVDDWAFDGCKTPLQSPGLRKHRPMFRYHSGQSSQPTPIAHHRTLSTDTMGSTASAAMSRPSSAAPPYSSVALSAKDEFFADKAGAKGLRTLRLTEQQHVWLAKDAPWLENAGKVAAEARHAPPAISIAHTAATTTGIAPVTCDSAAANHGMSATNRKPVTRKAWNEEELAKAFRGGDSKSNALHKGVVVDTQNTPAPAPAPLWLTLRFAFASVPSKSLLALGLAASLIGGGVTPVFSFFLGKLLATMGLQNQSHNVLVYALVVLGLAILEGITAFGRYAIMDVVGEGWVHHMRRSAFERVLARDKSWFDESSNSAGFIVARIVKDADDARNLIARVIGSLIVVLAMVLAGIIWALIVGWQLTLVGLAVGPVFVVAMTLQSKFVSKYEARNKDRREEVNRRFYALVSNIRGIRSMALEPVFAGEFVSSLARTERDAIRAAPLSGFGFGLGEGLTYLCEALLFYVGAVLIVRGTYDFERMVVVFNLFIFAVTFAGSTMAYLPALSKSIQATADLRRLVELDDNASSERKGSFKPSVASSFPGHQNGRGHWMEPALSGAAIEFHNVHFSYPTRPDVRVLTGASFEVLPGERVAIVGPSGCGKSTIAALLQRLYEPSAGGGWTTIDGVSIETIDTQHLRLGMTVVSQSPNLFDMTVAQNVAYSMEPRDDTDDVANSATRATDI